MLFHFTVSHLVLGLSLFSSKAVAQSFDNPVAGFGGAASPYLDWVAKYGDEYPRSLFLPSGADTNNGIALHWRIDEKRVHVAVAAKAQGWVGLGLSENGGMRGADIVYFQASDPDKVTDSHVLSDRVPVEDDCQDWTLTRSQTDDGFLIFEANRLIDTVDTKDRPLIYDAPESSVASRIIAAWGDSPSISYHGATNRARGQLRWFQTSTNEVTSFASVMMEQAEGYFDHLASNYAIGTNETQYVSFCANRTDLLAQGVPLDADPLYLIGFEPLVDARTVEFVHHYVVTGAADYNADTNCPSEGISAGQQSVYGWAPGEPAFALPDNLGLPFGEVEGLTSLRMVIHYDNPRGVENIFDSSGVRYYFTTQPRVEVGTMAFGDPAVQARGEAVGDGLTTHTFDCPASCSSAALDEPVTVIRENIHMHRTGVSGKIEQTRDESIIRTAHVDFFDFDQQGNHVLQQPNYKYQILPGDSFRLICEYNSGPEHVFGMGSDDEMCMARLYYYPRKKLFDKFAWICPYGVPLPACQSSYEEPRSLTSEDELGRIFGQSDGICTATQGTTSEAPTFSPSYDTETEKTASPNGEVDQGDLQVSAATGPLSNGRKLFWFLAFVFLRRKIGSKHLVVPLLVE